MTQLQQYLQQLLLSRQGLLITAEGYASAVTEAFPFTQESDSSEREQTDMLYTDMVSNALNECLSKVHMAYPEDNLSITSDYASDDIPDNTIAYYPVLV